MLLRNANDRKISLGELNTVAVSAVAVVEPFSDERNHLWLGEPGLISCSKVLDLTMLRSDEELRCDEELRSDEATMILTRIVRTVKRRRPITLFDVEANAKGSIRFHALLLHFNPTALACPRKNHRTNMP